jgi:hypothetical protein
MTAGFVSNKGAGSLLQMTLEQINTFVQVCGIPEHATNDRRMINAQTTLGHQLLQIAICEAISQVPPDAAG